MAYRCLAYASLALFFVFSSFASPIRTLAELHESAERSAPDEVHALELAGQVWYSNPASGNLFLADETRSIALRLPHSAGELPLGETIRISGKVRPETLGSFLALQPIYAIDNDGLHSEVERYRTLQLDTEYHPFRIDWFNAIGEPGLILEMEGPGLERQRIPADFLFTDKAETGKPAPQGLHRNIYHGRWWALPPNLDALTPALSGRVDYFDVENLERQEFVAASYQGYLKVPIPGEYSLYLLSDDGSRLHFGEVVRFSFSCLRDPDRCSAEPGADHGARIDSFGDKHTSSQCQ